VKKDEADILLIALEDCCRSLYVSLDCRLQEGKDMILYRRSESDSRIRVDQHSLFRLLHTVSHCPPEETKHPCAPHIIPIRGIRPFSTSLGSLDFGLPAAQSRDMKRQKSLLLTNTHKAGVVDIQVRTLIYK
jgi:hypothetical protein